VAGLLDDGDDVIAMLPFASIRKVGYGQLVFTRARLFFFDSTRTGKTGELLRVLPLDTVKFGGVRTGRFGKQSLVLVLPDTGEIVFDVGSREGADLAAITRLLAPRPT
jgi:hypothetical protein